MTREIISKPRGSKELTNLLTQLEKHGVKQVGSRERTSPLHSLAKYFSEGGIDKPLKRGVIVATLPVTDFCLKELSCEAKVSNCYTQPKIDNPYVLSGDKYSCFVKDLASKIELPEDWKFVLPKFRGFAMNSDDFFGTMPHYGWEGKFELCYSLSLAEADSDYKKIEESVYGGVLGKGTHFVKMTRGKQFQHLGEGMVLFPVYDPAVIGKVHYKGEEINLLEAIYIYPDKKVLDATKELCSGLVTSFFTCHPYYQFQWSKAGERYAYDRKQERIK